MVGWGWGSRSWRRRASSARPSTRSDPGCCSDRGIPPEPGELLARSDYPPRSSMSQSYRQPAGRMGSDGSEAPVTLYWERHGGSWIAVCGGVRDLEAELDWERYTPLRLIPPIGRARFLETAHKLSESRRLRDDLQIALFRPWRYTKGVPMLAHVGRSDEHLPARHDVAACMVAPVSRLGQDASMLGWGEPKVVVSDAARSHGRGTWPLRGSRCPEDGAASRGRADPPQAPDPQLGGELRRGRRGGLPAAGVLVVMPALARDLGRCGAVQRSRGPRFR